MRYPIIDVHHHIISTAMQAKQRELGIEIPSFFPKWSPERGMEKMDIADISFSFLSAPSDLTFIDQPSANALARQMNEELASYVQLYPQRYGAFATLPMPDAAASLEETIYALDTLKLDGVALLTSYQGKYLTDPDYAELLAELDKRSAVVFLHPILIKEKIAGLNPALLEGTFDTTRAVTTMAVHRIFDRYPSIRFILPHTGGMIPYIKWRIALAVIGQDSIQAEATTELFEEEMAKLDNLYYDSTLNLGTIQKLVEPSRILFGADIPWPADSILRMQRESVFAEAVRLDEANVRAIAYENAFRLFPRLATLFQSQLI
ncbi:putative TIM-barrel fold metal-dependent hydrolase [Paenibacillus phyllosphaerae]|uniref:Putative TIM-barrel fold metal-dependent hydrolase n=1 Tax=Paenibacillus phyllosphaerae TaxID=274593 RepID=A0A7W5AZ73_9BACL|nr:amidohydrolase family protein [Paenibacillus phyllosphaerae]MBB3111347.1 putative TIM-barrel fold metal-dependent hydrolase [Paenibacillus phyllosphaerae]